MKLKIIFSAALIATISLVGAHASEGEPIDAAELQQQLEQARQDLAEAAQRMARLQRELIQSEGVTQAWMCQEGNCEPQDLRLDLDLDLGPHKLPILGRYHSPPGLGVLLSDSASEDRNRILGITPGSAASRAGLQTDDRLIAVDGIDVTEDTSQRIREALATRKPGDTVDVVITRGDKTEHVMQVVLASTPFELQSLRDLTPVIRNIETQVIGAGTSGSRFGSLMGPSLTSLGYNTHLISNHLGLKPYFGTADGILVLHIDEDNSLNLHSGDVVLKIDGESVNRPVDFGRSLLSREHGEVITLQVMREGALTEVDGLVPEQSLPGSGARRIEVIRQRIEPDVS